MKFLALAFCFLFGASGTVAFAGPAEEANAVIDQWFSRLRIVQKTTADALCRSIRPRRGFAWQRQAR